MPHAPQFREQKLLDVLRCLMVLALVVLVPSALRYQFAFNSLAPGVLVCSAALLGVAGLGVLGRLPGNTLSVGWTVVLLVLLAISLHLGLSLFQWSADLGRAASSIAALALMLATAPIVYVAVFRASDATLGDALAVIRVAFLVMVVMAVAGYQPISSLASERPVWPFTEPSHFALAASPFLIHGCVAGGRLERFFWLTATGFIVLVMKSLSLAVSLAIAAACSLSLLEMAVFALAAGAVIAVADLSYFTDRLAISHDNSNLSSLVYLQGLELIQEALGTTRGWGIAFQQLGFAPTNVLATEIIRRVSGGEQNLADGSFLAVKLGAEFGVFGLAALIGYTYKLLGAVVHLRLIALRRAAAPVAVTFALCTYVSLAIELFVRGSGYFSGSALLAIAGFAVTLRVRFRQTVPTRPVLLAS